MSDEENKMTPQATPAWMQTQAEKAESLAPKSKRTRRTRAQMAEARASDPPPAVAAAIEDTRDAVAADLNAIRPRPRPEIEFIRRHHPTFIAIVALAISCAAYAR